MLLDEAEHHPDAARAPRRGGHVALLTPVAKAFFTELGHRSADEALQVWGGYGYVHDYGIEQTVRDSRIAMIYEGTNEIQAIDLVQRKLLDDGGARAAALIAELRREVDGLRRRAGAAAVRRRRWPASSTPGRRRSRRLREAARTTPSGRCAWPTTCWPASAMR